MYRTLDPAAAEVRAKHLRALVRLTPLTLGSTLLNGAIAWFALRPTSRGPLLAAWGLTLAVVGCLGLRGWWRQRKSPRETATPRAIRSAVRHATLLALIWASLPLFWYPSATMSQRLILAMLTTGMLGGGAMALAPIPMASLVYVVVMATGASLAVLLADGPLMWSAVALILTYSVTMIASAITTARVSVARLMSEREAAHQSHVIGLLLRDFEENAADVLWEIDEHGRLTHVSPRLGVLLGADPEALHGELFLGIIEARRPTGVSGSVPDVLRDALAGDTAFRDIVVPIVSEAAARWWSITAKPLLDKEQGVIGWRGVIGDVSERQEAQARLEYLAGYDALTGLANRRLLRDRVQRVIDGTLELLHRDASIGPSALLFLDLDHFKTINDTLGHAVGDAVLQLVARRLMSASRLDDFIVRLSGDEFAMVVYNAAGESDVIAMAERLLSTLREPTEIAGQTVTVSASIGVALIPAHGRTVDDVLGNADLALYAAKHAGRAAVHLFRPELGEDSRRRQVVERELGLALERREVSIEWQPQLAAGLKQLRGAEAILRWDSPHLGTVDTSEFISVAEESGQIDALGTWALNEACRIASALVESIPIAVRVSPRQLQRPDFVRQVQAALSHSGLAPIRLELEVTESLFLRDAEASLAKLQELKALGVRVALDDFGTGYSSLAYLRRFPFDTLKIDKAFVHELTHAGDARAVVQMVIALASTLGMETVAESIEEEAQLSFLQAAGCRGFQGTFVARPMSITELRTMMHDLREQAPRLMA